MFHAQVFFSGLMDEENVYMHKQIMENFQKEINHFYIDKPEQHYIE